MKVNAKDAIKPGLRKPVDLFVVKIFFIFLHIMMSGEGCFFGTEVGLEETKIWPRVFTTSRSNIA